MRRPLFFALLVVASGAVPLAAATDPSACTNASGTLVCLSSYSQGDRTCSANPSVSYGWNRIIVGNGAAGIEATAFGICANDAAGYRDQDSIRASAWAPSTSASVTWVGTRWASTTECHTYVDLAAPVVGSRRNDHGCPAGAPPHARWGALLLP